MSVEDIYKTEHSPLKGLDKGVIICLWKDNNESENDIVVIPHDNCYTKNASYGGVGQRIVGISTKTGLTYKENMGKNYKYKILKR